jgi:serine/threonine-protein kinase
VLGKSLGGRYEIQEKVGGGGMALVYRAHDTFLNRTVAVKLLRSQFVEDEEFLRRFRREAQSAARLTHPNVVNVYDVGQEGSSHYIVMEFVEGSTLKELVRGKGPLPPRLAAKIAYQISEALDHAHRNQVVHRDIKPHNILVMPSGTVKVTDFGIARAVSDTTLTNTGNIIGSVHYFSPEQARGGFTGEKSDLYSLGVVLYEMLTGTVPFKGDSPFSVAIKHLQEDVVPPGDLRPGIPEGLVRVVMKALEKDSLKRYRSAAEMKHDLGRVLRDLGDEDEEEMQILKVRSQPPRPKESMESVRSGSRRIGSVWKLVAAGIVLVALGTVIYGVRLIQDWVNVPVVPVPDVVGLSLSEAEDVLRKERLSSLVIAEKHDEKAPVGFILSQDPEAGETVKEGREIKLVMSMGPELVAVPDLVGKTFREADLTLKGGGLDFGSLDYQHSDDFEEGKIVSQSPRAGNRVSKGTLVDLVVSKGPEPRETVMPSLVGLRYEAALEELRSLKMEASSVREEPSAVYPAGYVISQTPSAGSPVMEGAAVNLKVSSGGATQNSKDIIVVLPSGQEDELVDLRLDLHDITGDHTVYAQKHRPGDVIRMTIQWYGPEARARIYLDGVFHRESILRG